MREGETSSKLIRNHKPMIYVRPIDPHTGKPTGEYKLPFHPGAFDWPAGQYQVVSDSPRPVQARGQGVLRRLDAPKTIFVPDPAGHADAQAPAEDHPARRRGRRSDVFTSEEDRWFAPRAGQGSTGPSRTAGPAQFIFSYVERHEIFDDFLDPPADPGKEGVARLRYADKAGKPRSFDVRIDDAKAGKPIPLPDSDLTASFAKVEHDPDRRPRIRRIARRRRPQHRPVQRQEGGWPRDRAQRLRLAADDPAVIPEADDAEAEAPQPLL